MEDTQPVQQYDVSVVIVNHNGGRYLADCLGALQGAVGPLDVETIVVDNGSSDGSADILRRAESEGLKVVWAGTNLGFGRANNLGVATASGRYYFLLNSDCFLRPGSLERLVRVLGERPDAGIVGPRLLNEDGTLQPSCHNFPVPIVLFLEQSLIWKMLGRLPWLRDRLLLASPHDREMVVDWLAGACLLVRAQAYQATKGFDEGFFFYWEETDLCLRIKQMGWDVLFEPRAEAVHLGGGSSVDPDLLLYFFKSLYMFYRKHYGPIQLLMARLIIRTMSLVKAVRALALSVWTQNKTKARELRGEGVGWVRIARL